MKTLLIIAALTASVYAASFEHMSTNEMMQMRGTVPMENRMDFRKEMQKRIDHMTIEERQEHMKDHPRMMLHHMSNNQMMDMGGHIPQGHHKGFGKEMKNRQQHMTPDERKKYMKSYPHMMEGNYNHMQKGMMHQKGQGMMNN